MNENTPISLSVMMQNSRSRDYGHGITQWEVPIQVGKENPGNVVAMVCMGGFGGTDATQAAVEATAIRIVDSYNALSGLNPCTIADMVEALKECKKQIETKILVAGSAGHLQKAYDMTCAALQKVYHQNPPNESEGLVGKLEPG